jgi:hypothetical protein
MQSSLKVRRMLTALLYCSELFSILSLLSPPRGWSDYSWALSRAV